MRIILPESARARKRAVGGTFVSTVLHVAIIGATIAATGWTAEAPRTATTDPPTDVVYVDPITTGDPPPPSGGHGRVQPTNDVRPDLPPASSFDFSIQDVLPPIDVRMGTESVDTFARMPVANGDRTLPGRSVGSETPMTSATVDRVVLLLPGSVPPRYPPLLASAGVEGSVTVQYVVDTLGRVERGSVHTIKPDRPEFERAVREALERMTFVPAEAGGRKVRQLVEQGFGFEVAVGKR